MEDFYLPEKLKNIPFDELSNVLEDPSKYGLTIFEALALADFMSKIVSKIRSLDDDKDNEYSDEKLKSENKKLMDENKKLKYVLATIKASVDALLEENSYDEYEDEI